MSAALYATMLLSCVIHEEFVGDGQVNIAIEGVGPFNAAGHLAKIRRVTVSGPDADGKFAWLSYVAQTAQVRPSGVIEFGPKQRPRTGVSRWAIAIPSERPGDDGYEFRADYTDASGHPIIFNHANGTCKMRIVASPSSTGIGQ